MAFDVSTGAAYAVLYSVLVFFTILAFGAAGWLDFIPYMSGFWTLNGSNKDHESLLTTDYFLSARNSASTWAIALSFFASGMGAWVLYGSTEMGATPELSWVAVLGYSSGSAFPAILICWLGPKVRNSMETKTKAFSTTDFGRTRYGRIMHITIACVSGFYMFIFIVAELTTISSAFAELTGDYSTRYGIGITISLGAFTVFYTTIAGLPASIVTDKFQGIIMAVLVIVLTLAVTTNPENRISKEEFDRASNWTTEGLVAAVTLIIAIACAELFNQGTWQRVWAAESVPAMRKGFALGSIMVFFLMMFFGVMGMIAYANDPDAYDNFERFSFMAFFDLLRPLKQGWHILTLILVTALAASSIDSLQNGLSSIFSRDLIKVGWNPKWIARLMMIAINVPAIYLASKKFDVLSLFLVADLVCATSVFPVFCGLQTQDKVIMKAPTELGAFLGCISGIVTVVINGIVNDAEGGLFEYFWLRNGAICTLCGTKTMVSFIVTPSVSLFMTYVFSFVDVTIRGERARSPIIPLSFDKDDEDMSISKISDTEKKGSNIDEEEDGENEDEADEDDEEDNVDDVEKNSSPSIAMDSIGMDSVYTSTDVNGENEDDGKEVLS